VLPVHLPRDLEEHGDNLSALMVSESVGHWIQNLGNTNQNSNVSFASVQDTTNNVSGTCELFLRSSAVFEDRIFKYI
jgi:hypothetical protein